MNYLVYRGLINPKYQGVEEVQTARRRLAKASTQLLLGEWLKNGHVHENYNAATGEGNDVSNSNPFCASTLLLWGRFFNDLGNSNAIILCALQTTGEH